MNFLKISYDCNIEKSQDKRTLLDNANVQLYFLHTINMVHFFAFNKHIFGG